MAEDEEDDTSTEERSAVGDTKSRDRTKGVACEHHKSRVEWERSYEIIWCSLVLDGGRKWRGALRTEGGNEDEHEEDCVTIIALPFQIRREVIQSYNEYKNRTTNESPNEYRLWNQTTLKNLSPPERDGNELYKYQQSMGRKESQYATTHKPNGSGKPGRHRQPRLHSCRYR